jgi:hypothetical protein
MPPLMPPPPVAATAVFDARAAARSRLAARQRDAHAFAPAPPPFPQRRLYGNMPTRVVAAIRDDDYACRAAMPPPR